MPVDATIPQLPRQTTAPLATDLLPFTSDPDGSPATKGLPIALLAQTLNGNPLVVPGSLLFPGDGAYYIWTPRLNNVSTVVGQWVPTAFIMQCPDNSLFYAMIPRLADNQVDIVIEWRAVGVTAQNPDNSLYYTWTPVLGNDGRTINGTWTLTSTAATAVPQRNPDNDTLYTWTPRLGGDGVSIIGQWV